MIHMPNSRHLVLVTFFGIFLGAFGLTTVRASEEAAVLPQYWGSNCAALPDKHSGVGNLTFTDTTIEAALKLYSDTSCKDRAVDVHFKGQYATGDAHGEGEAFDFIAETIKMTLLRKDVVFYYNWKHICGISNWKLREPREVSGLKCDPYKMPGQGARVYDIYKHELFRGSDNPESLRFGAFPMGPFALNADQRPTQLKDPMIFTVRLIPDDRNDEPLPDPGTEPNQGQVDFPVPIWPLPSE